MSNKKLQIWLPLILSATLIAGMYFGFKLRENTASTSTFFTTQRNTTVQEILNLIRMNYVDPVKFDSLQQKAIAEMMGQLDPHSVFIPVSELQEITEDMVGKFEGIGVEFNFFEDTVHVVYVLTNGPSYKAGIQIGDKIIQVNKEAIIGDTISSEAVKQKIRGASGTLANLTIIRNRVSKNISVTRGTIPLPAIDAAYVLNSSTGYIKLNRFSETAYEEFMKSLEEQQAKGISKLVLDLRGNGGGLMNEAVDIADEFLSDNKLIVYTEGLHSKKREYNCRRPGLFEEGKLIVLVDEFSASASEVLAGALQDWDRATIIGRRTFGKGLVQEQFSMKDGSALRLTTARYYTPVGRSIQRSYHNGKKEYLDEIFERISNGESIVADTIQSNKSKTFKTKIKKRTVYAGGGIMPDVTIATDTSSFPNSIVELVSSGSLNNFIYHYYMQHVNEISKFSSPSAFDSTYKEIPTVWNELLIHAAKDKINIRNVSSENKTLLQNRIKALLARYKWRTAGYFEVMNHSDILIASALKELEK